MKSIPFTILGLICFVGTASVSQAGQNISVRDTVNFYRHPHGQVYYQSKTMGKAFCRIKSVRHLSKFWKEAKSWADINALQAPPRPWNSEGEPETTVGDCAGNPLKGKGNPPIRPEGVKRLLKGNGFVWIYWNPRHGAYCEYRNLQHVCNATGLTIQQAKTAPYLGFNPLRYNVDFHLRCQ